MAVQLTARELAAKWGVSVTTMRRYYCGWCEIQMLSVARGTCGSIYGPKCNTDEKMRAFANDKGKGSRQ